MDTHFVPPAFWNEESTLYSLCTQYFVVKFSANKSPKVRDNSEKLICLCGKYLSMIYLVLRHRKTRIFKNMIFISVEKQIKFFLNSRKPPKEAQVSYSVALITLKKKNLYRKKNIEKSFKRYQCHEVKFVEAWKIELSMMPDYTGCIICKTPLGQKLIFLILLSSMPNENKKYSLRLWKYMI